MIRGLGLMLINRIGLDRSMMGWREKDFVEKDLVTFDTT